MFSMLIATFATITKIVFKKQHLDLKKKIPKLNQISIQSLLYVKFN